MQSYDQAYYLDRLEVEQTRAREADDVLVAAIHAELAKQYQIRLDQNGKKPGLKLVASS